MSRRRRPWLGCASVALTALAFFGAGCDTPPPAPKGVLAVERGQDGGVRLLLGGCPGFAARDFSVLDDTEGGDLVSWSVHNDGWTGVGARRTGLPGSTRGLAVHGRPLTALRKGVPYVANVNGSMGDRGLKGRVPFTVEDLEGLKSGEVLTWAGGDKNTKTSRDDFLRGDPARCRP